MPICGYGGAEQQILLDHGSIGLEREALRTSVPVAELPSTDERNGLRRGRTRGPNRKNDRGNEEKDAAQAIFSFSEFVRA